MALPVLLRKDSGFDNVKQLCKVAGGKDRWEIYRLAHCVSGSNELIRQYDAYWI